MKFLNTIQKFLSAPIQSELDQLNVVLAKRNTKVSLVQSDVDGPIFYVSQKDENANRLLKMIGLGDNGIYSTADFSDLKQFLNASGLLTQDNKHFINVA
jgi:hypothetical protein